MEDPKFGIVTTTLADEGDARDLAGDIIERRLAACVQVMPVNSIYRWQGKVETGREHMLAAYAHAKRAGYRFYSYGDACLLERVERA